ncbi:Mur ligase [Thamnocephalis sphaerospora]|uniref:Mur ligase n=1 Tax=Thamnocephalis sphaerospora TaxID=78915 RepID=A0A4P9XXB0_9FUNG|nr:Mur ligase [Thamnocephalis sphaerospora]|eukprot:RKP11006.1 Mur ligase [Thamnocephalis sphaerospora]
MDLGLQRTTALLAALDQPQQRVPFLHIAGTNGKGSTVAFLASIFRQAGLRVGTYSSPHFLHPRDAIRLNGVALSLDAWRQLRERVDATATMHNLAATEFERETVVAWLAFDDARVDLAVVECGLGGRLDATNAGHTPASAAEAANPCKLACVVAPIGLDHQRLLGDTVEAIAAEKAGIFTTEGGLVVLAAQSDPAADAVLASAASKMNCKASSDVGRDAVCRQHRI